MRNLIIFIRHYFNFFLFLALEIICLSMVFNNEGYQQTAWLHSSNAVSGYFYSKINGVKKYLRLAEVNDSLSLQNARLLDNLSSSYSAPDTTSDVHTDSSGMRQYRYFPAVVVNNSVSHPFNYITIHRGSKQGVKPGMGVIGVSGVVGVVRNVSDNYAVVMSLLNKDMRVSATLPRSGNFGSVVWNIQPANPAYGSLIDIPKNVPVYKGDTVMTSGYSAIFPPGLVIGYVDKIEIADASNFYQIKVHFATNFQSLQYVYVIENLNASEQKKVEGEIKHE